MKYLLVVTLFILTCCKQNEPVKVVETNKPIPMVRMEGDLIEIMEQVFHRYKVSYTFTFDPNKEKYVINMSANTPLETTIQTIAYMTGTRMELKNNTITLYEN